MRYLITGASGYVGGELKRALLADGHVCVNIDLAADCDKHENLISIVGSVADKTLLETIFNQHGPFDCVFHAAAQLQLTRKNRELFQATNMFATKLLAETCTKYNVPNFVFISSNCIYGKMNGINISEDQPPAPFEEYGKAKAISENILLEYTDKMNVIIFRPPTIIGEGRLGILSIVFDFIREHRKIWLIGSGENRYQFVYTKDLINACKSAASTSNSHIFNIGCDNVPTLNNLFHSLIEAANSHSSIYHLPQATILPAMKTCYWLGISPLGPYQYNMIANTYIGNTDRIKRELNWQPTKTNNEILINNYHYYIKHFDSIHHDTSLTGHRKTGKQGIIGLVKYFS